MDYVLERGAVQIDELVEAFGVSRMTVHRDLDALVRQGIVRKVRGGASALPSGLFESSFRFRMRTSVEEKKALARAALSLIEPGQALMLDDSTTVVTLAEQLTHVTPLTVVTNSLPVIEHLQEEDEISLISLGGRFSRNYSSFVGLSCERAIADMRVNLLFLSASAVSGTALYHQDEETVKIKRAMMAAAEQRVLLVDHRKFETTALNRVAEMSEFDRIMTTEGIRPESETALREAGIALEVVPLARGRSPARTTERE